MMHTRVSQWVSLSKLTRFITWNHEIMIMKSWESEVMCALHCRHKYKFECADGLNWIKLFQTNTLIPCKTWWRSEKTFKSSEGCRTQPWLWWSHGKTKLPCCSPWFDTGTGNFPSRVPNLVCRWEVLNAPHSHLIRMDGIRKGRRCFLR